MEFYFSFLGIIAFLVVFTFSNSIRNLYNKIDLETNLGFEKLLSLVNVSSVKLKRFRYVSTVGQINPLKTRSEIHLDSPDFFSTSPSIVNTDILITYKIIKNKETEIFKYYVWDENSKNKLIKVINDINEKLSIKNSVLTTSSSL